MAEFRRLGCLDACRNDRDCWPSSKAISNSATLSAPSPNPFNSTASLDLPFTMPIRSAPASPGRTSLSGSPACCRRRWDSSGARPVHPGGHLGVVPALDLRALFSNGSKTIHRLCGLAVSKLRLWTSRACATRCYIALAMGRFVPIYEKRCRVMDALQHERYRTWKADAARLCRVATKPPAASRLPSKVDVAATRKRLGQVIGGRGISQATFARRYGFSVQAVRAWEQGLRTPDVSARVLLLLIDRDPHLVDEVVDQAIERAAVERECAEPAEVEVVRSSTAPFKVQKLVRTSTRKRRNGVSA